MSRIKREIVIFDFCETLVDFQTADAFVDYVREHLKEISIQKKEKQNQFIRKSIVFKFVNFVFRKHSLLKRLKLFQLKGVPQDKLESLAISFYREKIKPHFIKVVLDELLRHKRNDREIWLISGGYGIYLKHFALEYGINHLLTSNIEFENGKCTGKLEGVDCMNDTKVKLFCDQAGKEQEYTVVASYSDSSTDIPILNIAEDAYVIGHKQKEWANKNKYKTIIW